MQINCQCEGHRGWGATIGGGIQLLPTAETPRSTSSLLFLMSQRLEMLSTRPHALHFLLPILIPFRCHGFLKILFQVIPARLPVPLPVPLPVALPVALPATHPAAFPSPLPVALPFSPSGGHAQPVSTWWLSRCHDHQRSTSHSWHCYHRMVFGNPEIASVWECLPHRIPLRS